MNWAHKQKQGFTIVELLIVVVVIAILAAITIVSYNGIVKRAQESAAQSSASQAATKGVAYSIENGGQYPTSLNDLGLSDTSTVSYDFRVSSAGPGTGYCITATSGTTQSYIAQQYTYGSGPAITETVPKSGACPDYSVVPTITNLVTNPSVESSHITGYNGPNSSTRTNSTARAVSGTTSLLVTMPGSVATGNVGVGVFVPSSTVAAGLKLNTVYTATAYVYVPTGTVGVKISIQGTGRVASSLVNPPEHVTYLKNNWVRIQNTFTTSAADGTLSIYILNAEDTAASATQFWADAFMLTEGTGTPVYADGESAGWTWSGTQHLSTSSGPAL